MSPGRSTSALRYSRTAFSHSSCAAYSSARLTGEEAQAASSATMARTGKRRRQLTSDRRRGRVSVSPARNSKTLALVTRQPPHPPAGCRSFSGHRDLPVDSGRGILQLYAVRANRFDLETLAHLASRVHHVELFALHEERLSLLTPEHHADEFNLSELRAGCFLGDLLGRLGRRPGGRFHLYLHLLADWWPWRQTRLEQVTAGRGRFRHRKPDLQPKILGPQAARRRGRALLPRRARRLPLQEIERPQQQNRDRQCPVPALHHDFACCGAWR